MVWVNKKNLQLKLRKTTLVLCKNFKKNFFLFVTDKRANKTSAESSEESDTQLISQRKHCTNAKLVMADNEYLAEDSGIVEEESSDRPSFTVSTYYTCSYLKFYCTICEIILFLQLGEDVDSIQEAKEAVDEFPQNLVNGAKYSSSDVAEKRKRLR